MDEDNNTLQIASSIGVSVCCVICIVTIVLLIVYRDELGLTVVPKPKELDEACGLHTDCKDWGPGATQIACCQGKCTKKQVDWAGIGYCPNECVGRSGGQPGSCGDKTTPGTKLGGSCSAHTDCNGWGPGATQNACCNGICTKKRKDWAEVGYCPHECMGHPLGMPGSC